jgi:8-oxo-dGTP pyrophosphatase MutT (NUDIX family)
MKQKAKVLIEYQGNLLLLNPLGKEKRTLIGGTVDKGESVFQSVIREAGEEAGVQLDSAMLTIAYRQLVTIN